MTNYRVAAQGLLKCRELGPGVSNRIGGRWCHVSYTRAAAFDPVMCDLATDTGRAYPEIPRTRGDGANLLFEGRRIPELDMLSCSFIALMAAPS